jgi:hypothetical protein
LRSLWSACCYAVETVVGNAICADGAAAFLLATDHLAKGRNPQVDFETFLDPEQLEEVGLKHQYGKLTDSTRTLDP